jgi:hypothetical protein
MDTQSFEFEVTVDDLIEVNGVEGLNEILDERMGEAGIKHTATDIGYEVTKMTNKTGLITITATYLPDFEAFGGEDDEDDEDGVEG